MAARWVPFHHLRLGHWPQRMGAVVLLTSALGSAAAAVPEWAERVANGPLIEHDANTVWWGDQQGHRFAIDDLAANGDARISSAIGPLVIASGLVVADRPEAPALLHKLVTLAEASQIRSSVEQPLVFNDSILTGPRLSGADAIILPEVALQRSDTESGGRDQRRAVVGHAAEQVRAALAHSAINDAARTTLAQWLTAVDDAGTAEWGDRVSPSFARRLLRNQWLSDAVADHELLATLTTALADADRLDADLAYHGDASRLERVSDAFGRNAWVLATPQRSVFASAPQVPAYHGPSRQSWLEHTLLVVALPAGSDPITAPDQFAAAQSVTLYYRHQPVVWWSDEGGFGHDDRLWRQLAPATHERLADDIVADYLPPHLLISDAAGNVQQLITAHGQLRPPANTSAAEGERFLNDAASALPDPAHLDLIGQHLFKYVYDSPDLTRPDLIGTAEVHGDIHQTALETLASTAGGKCRGDCDDLAEVYHELLKRQDRLAHVVSLPGHAALFYAEADPVAVAANLPDPWWTVYVLHTGPALQFQARNLPEALALAYRHFNPAETADANEVDLLLRFDGENTRSTWRLGWRVFADPVYAETMIDMQGDWHRASYKHAIDKIQRLIDSGDHDSANHRELASLYFATGQPRAGTEAMRQAIAATDQPHSRLNLSGQLAAGLARAGDPAAADVVRELLAVHLPDLALELDDRAPFVALRVAGQLVNADAHDLTKQIIVGAALGAAESQADKLIAWLSQEEPDPRSVSRGQSGAAMRLIRWVSNLSINLADHDALGTSDQGDRRLLRLTRLWLDEIMFRAVADNDDLITAYASAGRLYDIWLGEDRILKQILATEPPSVAPIDLDDHRLRVGGIIQMQHDLRWLHLAPGYWSAHLNLQLDPERYDPERTAALVEGFEAAVTACIERGLIANAESSAINRTRIVIAVLTRDRDALIEQLQIVADLDDKRRRDASAAVLARSAATLNADEFAMVLEAWRATVDYQPRYLTFAWGALRADAPERAQQAAAFAAARYPDDPMFAAEAAYIDEIVATLEP